MAEGRVAVVTGGSRGIGREIARALGERGALVAVNFTSRADAAEEVVSLIGSEGGTAMAVKADVADAAQVDAMMKTVTEEFGPVGILVNNAGIARDNLLLRMTPAEFDSVIATNLRSAYLCTKAALRGMLRSRWGRVISIASVAGIAGNPGQANYAASKAGLIGFSKSVAKEIGSRGITVNVVAPGFITTDMTDALDESTREASLERIALGRFGEAWEVASVVAFLASDAAGYVTGQVIGVDGGLAI